jgi:hypothetical protein
MVRRRGGEEGYSDYVIKKNKIKQADRKVAESYDLGVKGNMKY